MKNKHRALRTG